MTVRGTNEDPCPAIATGGINGNSNPPLRTVTKRKLQPVIADLLRKPDVLFAESHSRQNKKLHPYYANIWIPEQVRYDGVGDEWASLAHHCDGGNK